MLVMPIFEKVNVPLNLYCHSLLLVTTTIPGLERKVKMSVQILASSRDTSYKLITHQFQNRSRPLKCTSDVSIGDFRAFFVEMITG